MQALLLGYAATLAAIAVASRLRTGPSESAKMWSTLASLSVLCAVGAWRLELLAGSAEGGVALGIALNAALLAGTRLDPMNAVVHWPGESSYRSVRPLRSRASRGSVRRRKSAASSLLIFVVLAVVLLVAAPGWYGVG